MKILLADDSKTNRDVLSASLNELGHEVITASSGQQTIEAFKLSRPDLIILDVVMENMDGFECAKKIRAIDNEDWIPIIFLSSSVDDANIARGIDAGGDDYLAKPISEIKLAAKIKAMQRIADMRNSLYDLSKKLNILSATDPLTGLNNRLYFDKVMDEKMAEAERTKKEMALLFIDLDKFKPVNDTFGHHVGDSLLQKVAQRLKLSLRPYDFIARMGGDEFAAIISPVEGIQAAKNIAQKIIDTLSQSYQIEDHRIQISASIGISIYPSEGTTRSNWLQNADAAMYQAKHSGQGKYSLFLRSSVVEV